MGLEAISIGAAAILILGGLVWAAAYAQGRNAAKAKDLKASLDAQQRTEDAVAAIRADSGDFELGPDGRVRRRGGSPPSSVLSGSKPNVE